MEKIRKMTIILVIISCLCIIFMPRSIAASSKVSELAGNMTGDTKVAEQNSKNFVKVIEKVLGFLRVASGIVSVVVIAFTGFQYIIADTPNIKDELKKKMLPIIIGLVVVFSATTIVTFILGAVEGGTTIYDEPVSL